MIPISYSSMSLKGVSISGMDALVDGDDEVNSLTSCPLVEVSYIELYGVI